MLGAVQILQKPEMVSAHEEQLGEELAVYDMARSGAHKGPCDDKVLQKETRVSARCPLLLCSLCPPPTVTMTANYIWHSTSRRWALQGHSWFLLSCLNRSIFSLPHSSHTYQFITKYVPHVLNLCIFMPLPTSYSLPWSSFPHYLCQVVFLQGFT